MPPVILRRCHICKKFHASYLVQAPDLGGQIYLCYNCWKARTAPQPTPDFPPEPEHAEGSPSRTTDKLSQDPTDPS